jgi:hypothetical protein
MSSPLSYDEELAKKLWQVSLELTGKDVWEVNILWICLFCLEHFLLTTKDLCEEKITLRWFIQMWA